MYVFDLESGMARAAYAVPFADPEDLNSSTPPGKEIKAKHLVFSSLSALPDGRLLALERENFGEDGTGKHDAARYKAVLVLDPAGAENILGRKLCEGAQVSRTTLVNFAALGKEVTGVEREELPAKWEGIALTGIHGDTASLIVSSDNDFLTPRLMLERGGVRPVEFPKTLRPQPTRFVGLDVNLPKRAESTTPAL